MSDRRFAWVNCAAMLLASLAPLAAAEDATDLAKVVPEVLTKEQRQSAARMIDRDISRRSAEANARNREGWSRITTRQQWEKYRDERIERLRRSLGEYPPPPEK